MKSLLRSSAALLLSLQLSAVSLTPSISKAGPIDFLFGAGKFGRPASPVADCRSLFQRLVENTQFQKDRTWMTREVRERDPKYLNDREYLEEMKYLHATLGGVDTQFSKEFDTRFFYTATAKARTDGSVPMVDPDAKALVIYFHGSGTEKASGVNFAGKMNSLAKMGYSAVSFDLPFHREGSRNPALANTERFAEYVNSIIQKIRQPGQPVYLVGHSFGPDVISEYITRYPKGVDGAMMLSPGSFDKETRKWFENKTVYMTKTFGDVEPNNFGGRWATMVTSRNVWNNPRERGRLFGTPQNPTGDPTIANPELKVRVLSGDREEYIPGELDKAGYPTAKPRDYDVSKAFKGVFAGSETTIEPGVGHYIFAHEDAQRQDVVLRSILSLHGDSLLEEKALKAEAQARLGGRTPIDQLAIRYSQEPMFRSWLDAQGREKGVSGQQIIAKLIDEADKKGASNVLKTFGLIERQRVDAVNANIRATQQWAPAFYEENKAAIEQLGTRGVDPSSIHMKYLTMLKSMKDEEVRLRASAPESVFVLPERPQPQGPRPDRQGGKPQQPKPQKPKPAEARPLEPQLKDAQPQDPGPQ